MALVARKTERQLPPPTTSPSSTSFYLCLVIMKFSQPVVLLFSILVLCLQCKGGFGSQEPNGNGQIPKDSIGNDSGFVSDAQQYESVDRVIWQKPDLVIEQLGNVEGKTVADLGAGTGYFSRRLAYKGARVIAIDIDPKAIQYMEEQRSRFPVELRDRLIIREAKPDDPKLKRNEVDIVLLVNTYTFIDDRVKYFSKLKDAIRKPGQVLIIDFKKTETPFGPKVEERLDIKEVVSELESAGYQVIQQDESSLEYQYIIKAISN